MRNKAEGYRKVAMQILNLCKRNKDREIVIYRELKPLAGENSLCVFVKPERVMEGKAQEAVDYCAERSDYDRYDYSAWWKI